MQHCGADFMRLRIGIGHPGEKSQVTGYVLKRASKDVEAAVERNVGEAMDVMPLLIDDGLNAAMKALHTKERSGPTQQE
jgi:PTH1 family peptidyl-tRNA hydrolase